MSCNAAIIPVLVLLTSCVLQLSASPNRSPRVLRGLTTGASTEERSGRVPTVSGLNAAIGSCELCNNSDTCCDGSSCCNGGQFCCEANNTCCQDTCCKTDNEQCCRDPVNGGVCCESEWSFCCVPQPKFDLPSRCCPRWFVCCDLGEYGCCNPDTGLPLMRDDVLMNDATLRTDTLNAKHLLSGPPPNVYALIQEPTWVGPMSFNVVTVNVTTGATENVSKVQNFKTGGEEQRQFMFDKKRSLFYLLQADNNNDGHNPLAAPIRLFTIHPITGISESCVVVGATSMITGYHLLPESNTIVFATYWLTPGHHSSGSGGSSSSAASESSSSGSPLPDKYGYNFYHLDIATCSATLVAQEVNPTSPQFVDTYSGWFHDVTPDGSVVYRLGYENVVTSTNFGLGATVIVASNSSIVQNASTVWKSIPRPDGTHGAYISINFFLSSIPTDSLPAFAADPFKVWFASMAPTNNVTEDEDLSLYLWSPNDPFHNVSKIATFPNAHQYPAMAFGPLSEGLSTDCTQYVALVVKNSPLGDSYDTLSVVLVSGIRPPGHGRPSVVLESQLQPGLLAETVSPAGVGIPDPQ